MAFSMNKRKKLFFIEILIFVALSDDNFLAISFHKNQFLKGFWIYNDSFLPILLNLNDTTKVEKAAVWKLNIVSVYNLHFIVIVNSLEVTSIISKVLTA